MRQHYLHFPRITVDPDQMGGVPCVRGLRISIATVAAMVADSMTREEILEGDDGSAPKLVEKERGASSDVIAPRIGFHRCPYSHDLEVA